MAVATPAPARAQDEAVVDALAGILAAADARRYDAVVLEHGARHPDPRVRRQAALAMGRLGDRRATAVLLTLLSDVDTVVQQDAVFALGLLRDRSAVGRLREMVLDSPLGDDAGLRAEAIAAVARIGGIEASDVLRELLNRWGTAATTATTPGSVLRALTEAWRLGGQAPVQTVVQFAQSPVAAIRAAAIYSLARLHHPESIALLIRAVDDADAEIRRLAVRALTRPYVDSAGRDPLGVAAQVRRLVNDVEPAVRINALRALATYGDSTLTHAAIDRTADADPNVRLEAVIALGRLGGSEAAGALEPLATNGPVPLRRPALVSLARVDPGTASTIATTWMRQGPWYVRATAAEALGIVGGDTVVARLETLVRDPDGRVAAQAFAALGGVAPDRAREIATPMLGHPDPVVRTFAAERIAAAPERRDVGALVDAFALAQDDSIPDARLAIIRALAAVAQTGLAGRVAVEDELFGRFPHCDDYLVRRTGAEQLPAALSRWGPTAPIATGRDVGDYRELARRYLLRRERATAQPRLFVETERGTIVIQLYAADAPITVNALVRLAEQRFFDGQEFHRVIPTFVAQAGDPRGDGWGGPGFVLRDELNRRRFVRGTVGMALFGPDTGGSQFFIALTPQPHLEGSYPVVGQVVQGMDLLDRLKTGDRVRTVRRP